MAIRVIRPKIKKKLKKKIKMTHISSSGRSRNDGDYEIDLIIKHRVEWEMRNAPANRGKYSSSQLDERGSYVAGKLAEDCLIDGVGC